ncbi:MAG: hypothetical protein HOF66_04265 [Nitrosomonadaceae bacterium]|nr:hypothetical protein [Nitrosomonadaceae bacterium]MDC0576220.1 hypothetical protein [Nitrosomonadaceae bacterium]
MTSELITLILSTVAISCLHTATGPDHYLPFIVLSRSQKWSITKTITITVACGFGHILSSVAVGMVGVFLGWQLSNLDWFEEYRGNIAAWCLLGFGVAYLLYGLWKAGKNKPHKHFDVMNEDVYVYEHNHSDTVAPKSRVKVTPLVLFAIFVMGPTEPLLPLLFYSGVQRSYLEIIVLISVFAICTVLTMLTMVLLGLYGYSFYDTEKLEKYIHAIGGLVISTCGVGMLFLGW